MILTVTLNPSVDISYFVDQFQLDTVNRTGQITKTPGGKGLNVTRVLKQLGTPVTATGFLGGHIGELLKQGLDQAEIQHSFSPIEGETRNCIAVLSQDQQTEILEAGPQISEPEAADFLQHFEALLEDHQLVTISGSLPKGVPTDFYQQLLTLAAKAGRPVLLDTSGEALRHSLSGAHKPYLIKPNHHEIAELLHKESSKQIEELKSDLQHPLFEGVPYIVVTLGADGALIKHQQAFYKAELPVIHAVSPVGSGDASLSGMAAGLFKQQELASVFKTAMTTGLLNTLETQTGHIDMNQFAYYYNQIQINQL